MDTKTAPTKKAKEKARKKSKIDPPNPEPAESKMYNETTSKKTAKEKARKKSKIDPPKPEPEESKMDNETTSKKSAKEKARKKSKIDPPKPEPEELPEPKHEVEHEPLEMQYVVDKHPTEDEPPKFERKSPPKVSCFMAVFATRQLASKGDRSLYIKFFRRELFIYLFYLITVTIMVLAMNSGATYYYTRVMYDIFVDAKVTEQPKTGSDPTTTFLTSSDIHDFWNYVRGPMIEGLYFEHWYGSQINLNVKELTDREKKYGILYENQLMGVPRLRQIRVVKGPCPVRKTYAHLNRECYPEYCEEYEDKGDPKTNYWDDAAGTAITVTPAWKYRGGGYGHWGKLATYSGHGGVQVLQKTAAEAKQRVSELQTNLWIKRSTRAVFLDFTVYNANINLFCVVKLLWEFPATGGVTTSYSLRTVRLIRYISNWDFYLLLPCEILFVIFTLYYLIQEITEMCYLGCKEYIQDIWSWFDFATLMLSFTCIAFNIYRYFLVERTLRDLTKKNNDFPDFEWLSFWETQFNHAVSSSVFLVWVKVFKYVSFNRTMTQLSNTLSRCAKDILGFAIMFFIIFFAFVQLGYLVFGSQLEDYSTILDTVFTLTRLLLGDFDFQQLVFANRVMGPIFFIAYTFFIFFVLLNMFLAIINDTYSEVKAEIHAHQSEFEIKDYFKGIANSVKGIFGKKDEKMDAETAIRLATADGKITQDELRHNLNRYNFSSVEVEMFLARYELDQERVMDEEETEHILGDMDKRKSTEHDASSNLEKTLNEEYASKPVEIRSEDFYAMQARVETMEGALSDVLAKLVEMNTRLESRRFELVEP